MTAYNRYVMLFNVNEQYS